MAFMTFMPAGNESEKWTNDEEHTRIGFEIRHAGLSWVSGRFTDYDIEVKGGEGNVEDIKVKVKVRTASINTGVAPRDKHLRTKDFFYSEVYPEMTFESTRIEPLSPATGRLYGNLTIRDITKPVVLYVELLGKHESPITHKLTAGFRLRGVVNRADYKLGPGYVPATIAHDVHIVVDGEFAKD